MLLTICNLSAMWSLFPEILFIDGRDPPNCAGSKMSSSVADPDPAQPLIRIRSKSKTEKEQAECCEIRIEKKKINIFSR